MKSDNNYIKFKRIKLIPIFIKEFIHDGLTNALCDLFFRFIKLLFFIRSRINNSLFFVFDNYQIYLN